MQAGRGPVCPSLESPTAAMPPPSVTRWQAGGNRGRALPVLDGSYYKRKPPQPASAAIEPDAPGQDVAVTGTVC